MDAEFYKKFGNERFSKQDYGGAYRSYTAGLELSPLRTDLLSNRVAAALQLGLWQRAHTDAELVLQATPTQEKCVYRKIKSLWGLNRYEDALTFLKDNISHVKGIDVDKASQLVQQSKGEYNMAEMYTLNREERQDVAEYFGPVEIQPVPGKGRGLLATKELMPGRLIMCCKAFGIAFDKDTEQFRAQNGVDMEWDNNNDACIGLVVEKLKLDESLRPLIQQLYSGEDNISKPLTEENLSARVHDIVKCNAFRSEENTDVTGDGSRNFCGLWILPSYLNHSCIDSNAYHQAIGDMLFIRAVKKIRKGEEVTISYWSPTIPTRRGGMAGRNFSCDCRSCQLDYKEEVESSPIPSQISKLLEQIKLNFEDPLKCYEHVSKIMELRHGQEDLNVALLTLEVERVGGSLAQMDETRKAISILEAMHKVCSNNVFVRSSVFQSLNLVRNYVGLEDAGSVRKWWKVFKRDVVAAYGDFAHGVKVEELGLDEEEIAMYEQLAADPTLKVGRQIKNMNI